MSPLWDDVNARVSGLQTHLLSRGQLESLSRETDLAALSDALRRDGIVAGDEMPGVRSGELDQAVRRWAAGLLSILARWAGPRNEALPFVFDDEDRRSIRAMLRGAVQHASPEQRLAGLIPTPNLPERSLEVLSQSATPAKVVGHLAAWRHPFAQDLAEAIGPAEPDLYRLETMLARASARHARRAARAARDARLAAFVVDAIDLENAVTAIVLSLEGADVTPRDLFLPGGRRLAIGDFEEAIATHEPAAAGMRLSRALAGTPFATIIAHGSIAPVALEDELLRCRLRVTARQVALAPLGPIAVIHFALRLRAQVIDLERIVWTVALGAPRGEVATNLTTVSR
jgi:vacuolar-type H+-ATPase subunit C/Vma6